MIPKEEIVQNCKEATSGLVKLCNEMCINEISNDILYIVIGKLNKYSDTRVLKREQKLKFKNAFSDGRKVMYRNYIKHNFVNFDTLVDLVYKEQDKISEVDFNMYYTSELRTIIVVYLSYLLRGEGTDIMYHVAITLPPYLPVEFKGKFDVNWQISSYCGLMYNDKFH